MSAFVQFLGWLEVQKFQWLPCVVSEDVHLDCPANILLGVAQVGRGVLIRHFVLCLSRLTASSTSSCCSFSGGGCHVGSWRPCCRCQLRRFWGRHLGLGGSGGLHWGTTFVFGGRHCQNKATGPMSSVQRYVGSVFSSWDYQGQHAKEPTLLTFSGLQGLHLRTRVLLLLLLLIRHSL
jgi:hypothetical protein